MDSVASVGPTRTTTPLHFPVFPTMFSPLLTLPPELLHEIAFHSSTLTPRDIISLGSTCRATFYILIADPYAATQLHGRLTLISTAQYSLWDGALALLSKQLQLPNSDHQHSSSSPSSSSPSSGESGDVQLVSQIAPTSARGILLTDIRSSASFLARTGRTRNRVEAERAAHAEHTPGSTTLGYGTRGNIVTGGRWTKSVARLASHVSGFVYRSSSSASHWSDGIPVRSEYRVPQSIHEFVLWRACMISPHSLNAQPAAESVALLLAHSREAPSWDLSAAVYFAATAQNMDVLRILLASPLTPVDAENCVALAPAAAQGQLDIVQCILAHATTDSLTWMEGNSALLAAAQANRLDVVNAVLDDGRFDIEAGEYLPLLRAVARGHTEIVRALMAASDPPIDPNILQGRLVSLAARNGRPDVLRALLSLGGVPKDSDLMAAVQCSIQNAQASTALHVLLTQSPQNALSTAGEEAALAEAAINGRNDAVAVLLEHGRVDPNFDNGYILRHTAEHGHSVTVALLLSDPRTDPSALGWEALMGAACTSSPPTVALLLSKCALARHLDPSAQPAIDESLSITDHPEIRALLLQFST